MSATEAMPGPRGGHGGGGHGHHHGGRRRHGPAAMLADMPDMTAAEGRCHGEGFGAGPVGPPFGPEFGKAARRGARRGGRGMPGDFPGPMFGRGAHGARVRRAHVRPALLALLAERPMHGYQMIRELAERSGGAWRPSPGSVYPVLQMLEDEGLVRDEETNGKRVYQLTDSGRAVVEARRGEPTPWDAAADAVDDGMAELRSLALQVGAAVMQVAQAGTDEQIGKAHAVLAGARRALYRILAEDGPGNPEGGTS